ncbi:type I restriction endonuclease subunit R [Campylobacter jejuni]|uniref:type I restriction endonuclease subunit R n=1 Tax=Campylobacter TaxID=194 RepID=UPI0008735785|nr:MULTISPECIES: type I restriction endonuclease subunit R [Campylobacter]EAL7804970.1 type I restriction endonuclease subunit R [Campylobacter jejuni]EDF9109030.1 HsdR family type I site-specific deoxyribonuclease [Campylobacter jejuni]EDK9199168.1 type I restriction endonuclease subunit R [Campylobacter jejuni]EGK7545728.1 type I restriction endonuclease subunit R [Campylobacter jejuni]EKY8178307.1 type I restriction endonuclease subunit R [Campylobacter jejuni]
MNDLMTQNDNTTIITEYKFTPKEPKAYQSEEDLERFLIKELTLQGYERLNLSDINDLESNFKLQLQRLNNISFSPTEWESFYKQNITNLKLTFEDKTKMLQSDGFTLTLEKEDGSKKNIILIDRVNPINNHLQVISQLKNENGEFKNRYDVSILVNGLPLVHIELKRRGVNLKEAFNQIRRYQKESFLERNALYEFVQIFIISNGTLTKYYSNTNQHKAKKSQNDNYAFCMSFSDAKNNIIEDLEDFAKTFLAKRNLLNILTKYCVFNADNELLIMRPYQIAASERIIDKIKIAHNHKHYGSVEAGGYIWHSTGSGKTLTSFKTAILATKLNFIQKVLFVVDRKDLDYQTQKEYDKFEKGAANATKNTNELKRRIESTKEDEKIIITTIQKLSKFVQKYENSRIFDSEIVFIFDECHRSQFGLMHEQIIKKFKKYYIFGFTGTPIFEENASKNYFVNSDKNLELKTTQSTFGTCLHSYTILNAIKDKNVLPFKVSYHSTMKQIESDSDKKILTIDRESSLLNDERIEKITSYILENFNRHTKRQNAYMLKNQRVQGFNAIFATASVDFAKKYYEEFSRQLKQNKQDLKVGIIYSYEQNEDLDEFASDSQSAKEFLSNAIKDYNSYFKSDFSLEKFDNYYKDISQKLKNKELDLLIVVNMFLTGFDSKTINTLYVDKNLKYHGLLQAFSRTNRILNEQKNCGNVVCFRDLENATNESLKMFGDEKASSIVLLENFAFYFEKYSALVDELKQKFELLNFPLKSEKEQKEFIKIFNEILKLENILNLFDEFKNPLNIRDKQDYQSYYLELYTAIKIKKRVEKENINDDLIFEIELIKQNEINVDFILFLLEEYHKDSKEKTKENILKTIISNPSLRDKKELIEGFLNEIDHNKNSDYKSLFESFMQRKKEQELQKIIEDENLNEHLTKEYLDEAFGLNFFQDKGEGIGRLLPLINPFAPKSEGNDEKRQQIINKLKSFFDKFVVFLKKEENE